ncbi:MAG: ABC transporter ATP-binding protein [Micromonosporaceae bacterium]
MTTAPARTSLAILDDVRKTYGAGATAVHALRGVRLRLEPGELVVVLGPSGSGKTTLLNLVGGIERPTAGQVFLGGQDTAGRNADALTDLRRDTVGFVFQFFNLIPTLTAWENVAIVAELTGREVAGRVDRALQQVRLTDRAGHFPGQLSGGEQQRVAIARAVVLEPPLLLCDEPTGSLDLATGRGILALLQRLVREPGRGVLLVTHNQAIAAMADRVLHMRSGLIVDDVRNASPIDAESVSW